MSAERRLSVQAERGLIALIVVVLVSGVVLVSSVLVVAASYRSASEQIRSQGRAAFQARCIGAVLSAQAASLPVSSPAATGFDLTFQGERVSLAGDQVSRADVTVRRAAAPPERWRCTPVTHNSGGEVTVLKLP